MKIHFKENIEGFKSTFIYYFSENSFNIDGGYFNTSLKSKFVRDNVIGRSLKEVGPPLEDWLVAAGGWLLETFSIAISTGDSSFQMATTTAFVL